MNSVIMDDVTIGDESIVGAMAFVKANTEIPARSLVVGNPAKVVKQVTDRNDCLENQRNPTLPTITCRLF